MALEKGPLLGGIIWSACPWIQLQAQHEPTILITADLHNGIHALCSVQAVQLSHHGYLLTLQDHHSHDTDQCNLLRNQVL